MDVYFTYSAEQLIREDGICPNDLPWNRRWEILTAKLQPINTLNFARVAMDMLTTDGERRNDEQAFRLSRDQLLELLEGLQGIERLEANAHILIHLAFLLQQKFSPSENVADEMFVSFRSLWWHAYRLRAAERNHHGLEYYIDMYGRNVVIDYYRIVRQFSLFCAAGQ